MTRLKALACAALLLAAIAMPARAQSTFPPTTDRSGAVTTGGTSQTLAAANPTRRRIIIVNPCSLTTQGIAGAETLFVNFGVAASATAGTSIEIATCGTFDTGPGLAPPDAVTVTAITTGHKFTAKEW